MQIKTSTLFCLRNHLKPLWTAQPRIMNGKFDPLSATASQLEQMLDIGNITSVQLVEEYFNQIEKHNKNGLGLNAIISLASREKAFDSAKALDEERSKGTTRGPMHGNPVVVKDIFDVIGMPTTGGSFALLNATAKRNAILIDRLEAKGLIIIAKANLSELGACKGSGGIPGLSAVGGQTQPAYVKGGLIDNEQPLGHSNPGGSSSGSAVAVAAGFAPVSIGGEGDGSLNTPASRAALYALKITPGVVPRDGILTVSRTFETVGGMAKSVLDLAHITEAILSTEEQPRDFAKGLVDGWAGISLGFVDPATWQLPKALLTPDKEYKVQTQEQFKSTVEKVKSLGATVHFPVPLPSAEELVFEGESGFAKILFAEVRDSLNRYLRDHETSPVKNLEQLIQWNKDHPDLQAGIGQEHLINSQNDSTSTEDFERAKAAMKELAGRQGIDKMLDEYKLDAIVGPMNSPISTFAALAGYPSATVPLGYLSPSGCPFGLCLIAKANEEEKLLRIMSAYEATFPGRNLPGPLVDASKLQSNLS